MIDLHLLGNRIRELRHKRGITQTEFAKSINVSFQAVSNWERGIAPPDLDNLILIASYFHVLTDDLLRPNEEELLLGIDGGGTKTEFVLCSADGRVLKQFIKKGCNPNDVGFEDACATVCGGIHDTLVEFPSVRYVFCGISGITVGDYSTRMKERLEKQFPSLLFGIGSDSVNLFAMDEAADMALISGTGSVVFVRRGEQMIRLGGWGYLFDSAGSAYDIGRDAVTDSLEEEETGQPPSPMRQLLVKKLGTPNVWSALGKLYKEGKPFIASLASVVFDAYRQEDEKAVAIIDRNAKRLGELLNLGVKLHAARPRAVVSGGILENYGDIMLPHLKRYTDTEIVLGTLPPVYGACRRAQSKGKDRDRCC